MNHFSIIQFSPKFALKFYIIQKNMLVAKDKIKTNIGEYFLYMYQIEDLIRACNFNKSIIESNLVAQYQTDTETKHEIKDWYFGLSDLMEEEKLNSSGHLSTIKNKIDEVFDFHLYLLQKQDYVDYQTKYKEILPILQEIKPKQGKDFNDVETIISTIYGVYLLKLKKQEITKDTLDSSSLLSRFMALLSKMFREYEIGELKIE